MDYTKKLFNLNPDKAGILDQVSEMTGQTKSQIMNDALAVAFDLCDPMVESRQETVRLAIARIRSTTKPTKPPANKYPEIPPSGAILNDRKPTRRRNSKSVSG